ncbi:hypothetical protein B566_EDAN008706, partial [Ephemera danica]
MIILGCAYFSYVGAELFIFSGSVSLIGCGVLVLSGLYNALGGRRIRMRDQVVIAYCGLRGAVCFALASMLVDFPMKDIFVSITIVLILWTIFV